MWVINPLGALTTLNGRVIGKHPDSGAPIAHPDSHPNFVDAVQRANGWREASKDEIRAWARSQSALVVAGLEAESIRRQRPAPKKADKVNAVNAFYRSQGFKEPSINEMESLIADPAVAAAAELLDLGDEPGAHGVLDLEDEEELAKPTTSDAPKTDVKADAPSADAPKPGGK